MLIITFTLYTYFQVYLSVILLIITYMASIFHLLSDINLTILLTTSTVTLIGTTIYFYMKSTNKPSSIASSSVITVITPSTTSSVPSTLETLSKNISHSFGYSLVNFVLTITKRKNNLSFIPSFYARLLADRKNNSLPSYWNRRLLQFEIITTASEYIKFFNYPASSLLASSVPTFINTRLFHGIPQSLTSLSELEQSKQIKGILIYLHGGCYTFTSTPYHWNFVSHICSTLQYRLFFIQYPLAPESTVTNTLQTVEHIISSIMLKYPHTSLHVMGDSAGGGLTLSVIQKLATSLNNPKSSFITKEQYTYLKSCTLIAPWLDIQLQNPNILSTLPNDPMLDIPGLQEAGKLYAGIHTKTYKQYYNTSKNKPSLSSSTIAPNPSIITYNEEDLSSEQYNTLLSSPYVNPLYGTLINLPLNIT